MPPDILAKLIAHLDQPDPSIWRELGKGFSSSAIEYLPDNIVVRVARSDNAGRLTSRMAAWLIWLTPHLPFSIPRPIWQIAPGTEPFLPFGAIGYPKLTGATLHPATVTDGTIETLAATLASLHNVELSDTTSPIAVGADQVHIERLTRFEAIRALLVHHLSPAEWRWIERWQNIPVPVPTRQTIVHGDFWHENILIEPAIGRLTGVIDWEGVDIGDPAQDLVPLRYLGGDHAERVLCKYLRSVDQKPEDLEPSLTWWWQYRDFAGIYLAMQMNDQEEIEDGIRKLRAGPILTQ